MVRSNANAMQRTQDKRPLLSWSEANNSLLDVVGNPVTDLLLTLLDDQAHL